jgi:ssDNA-binding Zn-finger/Zn-ribbon topoisomerase 1
MMTNAKQPCPHCGGPLVRWRVPDGATWQEEYFLACFNDECPYYVEGWNWMLEQYNQSASYRYALNPRTGTSLMIPVWSASATREMIEEDDEEGDA